MRKFSCKHNNKGTVSRKGECSIERMNRLQHILHSNGLQTFTKQHLQPYIHLIAHFKSKFGQPRWADVTWPISWSSKGMSVHIRRQCRRQWHTCQQSRLSCTPSRFCFLIVLDRKIIYVDTDFFSGPYEESKWENYELYLLFPNNGAVPWSAGWRIQQKNHICFVNPSIFSLVTNR